MGMAILLYNIEQSFCTIKMCLEIGSFMGSLSCQVIANLKLIQKSGAFWELLDLIGASAALAQLCEQTLGYVTQQDKVVLIFTLIWPVYQTSSRIILCTIPVQGQNTCDMILKYLN